MHAFGSEKVAEATCDVSQPLAILLWLVPDLTSAVTRPFSEGCAGLLEEQYPKGQASASVCPWTIWFIYVICQPDHAASGTQQATD